MSEQRISEQDPPNGRTALYAESLSRLIRLETVSGPGTSGSKKFHAFRELLKDMPYVVSTRGDMNTEIREITSSSRDKTEGGLFFCIVGARFDAHDFAWEAVENGCVALIVERYIEMNVPQVLVSIC